MGSIVATRAGRLEGTQEGGVQVFRGIPFAAPPTGPLRFRPPEAVRPWSGVRSAVEVGASAPQNSMMLAMLPGMDVGTQNEDCLYLNVYTPSSDGTRRPVMVWIHGGGFFIGSGSQAIYDGIPLARRGDVVLVTVNYRLGALGFLHLGERAGPGFETAGNSGLLDQIAALEWVRDNIEAFGGDPENVTIFGESAGGMSVGSLLGTPRARGLFQRAILQSGAAHNVHEPKAASGVAGHFLEELGLGVGEGDALRQVPVDQLLSAQGKVTQGPSRALGLLPFQPVIDGVTLPEQPLRAIRHGSAAGVSLLIGSTREEWNLFSFLDPAARTLDDAGLLERIEAQVPEGRASDLIGTYRESLGEDADPMRIFRAMQTDRVFRIPALRLADAQTPHAPAVYQYQVTWSSPALGGALGACHAVELPFVFGTLEKDGVEKFVGGGPEATGFSEKLMDAWTAFARCGDPFHPGLPEWPPYELSKRATMLLGPECHIDDDPGAAERAAWEGIL